jgi:Domain of unknown function (DUF397)
MATPRIHKEAWKKSSYSAANGDCIEVATTRDEIIAVRDSKDPKGPVLSFAKESWASFVAAAQQGAFPAA